MSTAVMAKCWSLQMPPTAKAVLVSLADNANDHGECWPSIPTICERTCFGKTAVIAAIQWLEDHGAVQADRSNGRHTRYCVTPELFDPSASRTGTADKPVRQAIQTRPPRGVDPSASRTGPVRQADSNRQEPSRTVKKATVKTRAVVALPDWLPPDAWAEWCQYRRGKTWTPKAQELSLRSLTTLRDQGHDPVTVIENAIEKGWRGLYAPAKQQERTNAASRGMSAADRIAAKIRERGITDDGFLSS